jgi:PKD repeat protein
VTTPASYNNGQWHHVVATQSSNGMKLYVDGALVGTNPNTGAEDYPGYWKVGGDNTWGSSNAYFDGTIDEVAVYLSELSATRVAAHYAAAQPAPNQPPAAAFNSTKTNLTVNTDGSASTDPDGTIVNYAWDFGDTWTTNGATPTASHSYAAAGTYPITLTVTDDDGSTNSVTQSVKVVAPNQTPTARFGTTMNRLKLDADASASSDPDGTIADYAWDFGDSTTGSGKTPTHTYAAAGSYLVTLTVTDNRGGTDTVTHTVVATAPNQDPVAAFSSSTTNLKVDVDGTASSDPDGTIANYAWDFGDSTPVTTGSTKSHTYAASGTYTISLTVTDNDGATNTVTHQVTVAPANQSPTAAFTTSTTNLKVTVNGSGSSDPDGTIASYAWTYGDGGTGTGVSDSHTYAAAGDYLVTLVVTDNVGATSTLSKTVTVTAPPANQPPTARFTSTTSNLTANVNGSTSSDPDGTIAGYSWTFGDGGVGTGATTSHLYGSAGTYTVTLTVTDNNGAVDTVSHSVTVTAPAVVAADDFERTVTNGWGTATTGGAWTVGGTASNYGVLNGAGTMRMAAGSGPSAYLSSTSSTAVDLTTSFSYDKPGTGGGIYTSLVGRRIGTSDYRAKVQVTATGTTLYLVRTVHGTETVLSSQAVSGMVVAANETVNLRLQVSGTGTTTIRAKIWKGGTEPAAWRLSNTDTTASLQAPGSMGFYNYLSSSATNAPVVVSVLDFRAEPLP